MTQHQMQYRTHLESLNHVRPVEVVSEYPLCHMNKLINYIYALIYLPCK